MCQTPAMVGVQEEEPYDQENIQEPDSEEKAQESDNGKGKPGLGDQEIPEKGERPIENPDGGDDHGSKKQWLIMVDDDDDDSGNGCDGDVDNNDGDDQEDEGGDQLEISDNTPGRLVILQRLSNYEAVELEPSLDGHVDKLDFVLNILGSNADPAQIAEQIALIRPESPDYENRNVTNTEELRICQRITFPGTSKESGSSRGCNDQQNGAAREINSDNGDEENALAQNAAAPVIVEHVGYLNINSGLHNGAAPVIKENIDEEDGNRNIDDELQLSDVAAEPILEHFGSPMHHFSALSESPKKSDDLESSACPVSDSHETSPDGTKVSHSSSNIPGTELLGDAAEMDIEFEEDYYPGRRKIDEFRERIYRIAILHGLLRFKDDFGASPLHSPRAVRLFVSLYLSTGATVEEIYEEIEVLKDDYDNNNINDSKVLELYRRFWNGEKADDAQESIILG